MAFRLFVLLTLVSFALVISCGSDAKPTEDPFAQGVLGAEDPDPVTPIDPFDDDTLAALKSSPAPTVSGTNRSLRLELSGISATQREIGTEFKLQLAYQNLSIDYVPEKPHTLVIEMEYLVFGSINVLSKPPSPIKYGGGTRSTSYEHPILTCSEVGPGSFRVVGTTVTPDDVEDINHNPYSVTLDAEFECIEPPTPTPVATATSPAATATSPVAPPTIAPTPIPPTPPSGETLSILVLQIDGLHYPFEQFNGMTFSEECPVAFVSATTNYYKIVDDQFISAGSPILSLENSGATSLSSSDACGFGPTTSFYTLMIDVNPGMVEGFCENYERHLVPEVIDPEVRRFISILVYCDRRLEELRRE